MELDAFIEKTLVAIATGTHRAEPVVEQLGGRVNVIPRAGATKEQLYDAKGRAIRMVEFDVAVAASSSLRGQTEASAGIQVLGIELVKGSAGVDGESQDSHVSRIRFSIPVVLP